MPVPMLVPTLIATFVLGATLAAVLIFSAAGRHSTERDGNGLLISLIYLGGFTTSGFFYWLGFFLLPMV